MLEEGWSCVDFGKKIVSMEDNCLPKIRLNWDANLKYVNTLSNNMKEHLYELNMIDNFDNK